MGAPAIPPARLTATVSKRAVGDPAEASIGLEGHLLLVGDRRRDHHQASGQQTEAQVRLERSPVHHDACRQTKSGCRDTASTVRSRSSRLERPRFDVGLVTWEPSFPKGVGLAVTTFGNRIAGCTDAEVTLAGPLPSNYAR